MSTNEREYNARYQAENIKQIRLGLSVKKDADIIQWLEQHTPTAAYLKQLIRADMNK